MSGRRPAASGVVALCLLAAGCGPVRSRGLTLAGSTSLQPFAEKWAESFTAQHPDTPVQVQGGGSTAGVQSVLSGAAQIGMSSRALTDVEAARLTAVPVARDGLALIVHPRNPLAELSSAQVRAIFAGQLRRWPGDGGKAQAITVITREEGSGTRAAFEELVMAGQPLMAAALVSDATGAVRQMVASDPAAIGYVSLGVVDATVKALRLDGVEPSQSAIDARRYPLVRTFLLLVRPAESGAAARSFIEWVVGPQGQSITRREGLLPPRG